jgi:hypothetical protein
MRKKTFVVGSIVILIVVLALAGMAQSRIQQRGAGQSATQAAMNTDVITLVGTVTAVSLAPGQGMPSITLLSTAGEVTIMIGPYRLLMDQKFEIKQNQVLEIKAFQDPRVANAYVATEIKDTATGVTVVLRDAAGMPHPGRGMMGMAPGGAGRGMMRGMGTCSDCANLDLKAKTTFEGTVQDVAMAAGQGFPNFTLQVGHNLLTIVTGPYWALQQADFKISKGDHLSVVAYPSLQHVNAFVAAAIENLTTQKSIKLRDDNGIPLGMRGRGPMRGIRR